MTPGNFAPCEHTAGLKRLDLIGPEGVSKMTSFSVMRTLQRSEVLRATGDFLQQLRLLDLNALECIFYVDLV